MSTEFSRWWHGHTSHHFSVEKGLHEELQINIDLVIPMACEDLHVNVQDASGDRILAAHMLHSEKTLWKHWDDSSDLHSLGRDEQGRILPMSGLDEHDDEVDELFWMASKGKFPKTPRLKSSDPGDSCRIFGSLEMNKVQGDFHITARGHGYVEGTDWMNHLEHDRKS
jgi:endoplasmic reticulum-Golgi intermediate compartment protein 2